MEESKKNEIVRILSKDPEHRYYVYRLVDPRNYKTFHVGKGCGDRMFQHVDNYFIFASDNITL